jgi:hypothetical protein
MTHKRTPEGGYFIWGYILMSFFNFLVLIPYFSVLIELFLLQYCFRHCAFCNLEWGITIYHHLKKKIIYDLGESTVYNN